MGNRLVCQFSCGAASAVATKLILNEKPADLLIVNAFLEEEHEDNRRFLWDCEDWFRHPITVLRDEKYGASTLEVWRRKRYIKGPNGAPCAQELKRKLLASISQPGDVIVLGFTAEEEDRLQAYEEHFPNERFRAPLIDYGLTKSDCKAILDRAGILLPMMYRLGYDNANCIGCPKGGMNYWRAIRRDFPERFIQIKTIQEDIGPGAYFLRFRSGPRAGERMSLAELPPGPGRRGDGSSFECSFLCQMAEEDISNAL